MSVSVVIPSTLTNPACGRALDSVVRAVATVDDGEVLVVANGAGPRRCPPALAQPSVRVLECSRTGPSAARNFGLAAARHSVVLFTDDDCVVPPTWCSDMANGIRRAGTAAAGAPVDVLPVGPVTAFLNHQRIFHAPALDATRVRFLVTAACAVDRTRTAARFDESLRAGEDAEFGHKIRDHGGDIAWLDVPSVCQSMVDTVDQIGRRFIAYGRAGATLYLRGRASHRMPYAHAFYRQLCGENAGRRLRRFRELPDPAVRAVFANLELVVEAATLAGYLAELGHRLGHELVALDADGLRAGWRDIFDQPAVGAQADWADLRPDPTLLTHLRDTDAPVDAGPAPNGGLRGQVAEVLSAHAALLPPPAAVREALEDRTIDPTLAQQAEAVGAIARSLAGSGITMRQLDRSLRAAGVRFSYGMRRLEQVLDP
jgi:glycosyltransferase involved in cell wall biosynthesis